MKNQNFKLILLSLSILCFSTLTYAIEFIAPKFGSEFTFTNNDLITDGIYLGDHIVNSPSNEKARDLWAEEVKKRCPQCQVSEETDKYGSKYFHIIHPDNLWFNISLDPWVVETQMSPLTAEEVREKSAIIQHLVFDAADSIGLRPHERIGGGHIHIDYSTSFKNRPQLFRNFLVDYQNNVYLPLGIFGVIPDNSPNLAVLKDHQRQVFDGLIQQYDMYPELFSPIKLAERLQRTVYNSTYMPWAPSHKYQAINVDRLVDPTLQEQDKTVEIRGFRPQRSVEDYYKMLTIIQTRLNYLNELTTPVIYQKRSINLDSQDLRKITNPQAVVDEYYQFITEMGLSYRKYHQLLPDELTLITPKPLQVDDCDSPNNQLQNFSFSDLLLFVFGQGLTL